MGIALFGLDGLMAPLRGLWQWMARPSPAPRHGARLQPAPARTAAPTKGAICAAAHRPLRVVRVVEGSRAAGAGRMFMSGRMADICAELERLAALEAATS